MRRGKRSPLMVPWALYYYDGADRLTIAQITEATGCAKAMLWRKFGDRGVRRGRIPQSKRCGLNISGAFAKRSLGVNSTHSARAEGTAEVPAIPDGIVAAQRKGMGQNRNPQLAD